MNAKERVVLPFVPVDMSKSTGKIGLYNHSFRFVCLKLTVFWHKLLRSRSRWKAVNSRSLQPGFCGHTRFRWLSRPVFSVQNRSRLFSRPVPFRPVPINRWWKPVQCWFVDNHSVESGRLGMLCFWEIPHFHSNVKLYSWILFVDIFGCFLLKTNRSGRNRKF